MIRSSIVIELYDYAPSDGAYLLPTVPSGNASMFSGTNIGGLSVVPNFFLNMMMKHSFQLMMNPSSPNK